MKIIGIILIIIIINCIMNLVTVIMDNRLIKLRKKYLIDFIIKSQIPYVEHCKCKFVKKLNKIKYLEITIQINQRKEIYEKLRNKKFYSIETFKRDIINFGGYEWIKEYKFIIEYN